MEFRVGKMLGMNEERVGGGDGGMLYFCFWGVSRGLCFFEFFEFNIELG